MEGGVEGTMKDDQGTGDFSGAVCGDAAPFNSLKKHRCVAAKLGYKGVPNFPAGCAAV